MSARFADSEVESPAAIRGADERRPARFTLTVVRRRRRGTTSWSLGAPGDLVLLAMARPTSRPSRRSRPATRSFWTITYLSRHSDPSPPSDPARVRPSDLGSVQGGGKTDLSAAPLADGSALCAERHRHDADRPIRRQDDPGRGPVGRSRLSLAGRLVPRAGRGRTGTSPGRAVPPGSSTGHAHRAVAAVAKRGPARRGGHARSPMSGCCNRRCAMSAPGSRRVDPPASTEYRVEDGQVVVPSTAAARKGIQPVALLTANGGDRVEAVGETRRVPCPHRCPGGGPGHRGRRRLGLRRRRRLSGVGAFSSPPPTARASRSGARLPEPGTYFPALRATAQRQGNNATRFARAQTRSDVVRRAVGTGPKGVRLDRDGGAGRG